ncbi:MAG: histidine phosphatase family protein [Burkholderiaceae bacterium]
MRLWLLRHARVQLPEGTCYGASDVPADPGLTEAAADHWAGRLPGGVTWRVSGLGRAQQLARAIRNRRNDLSEPRVDVRLNEMDFGRWEMRPWDAVDRSDFDAWMASFAHHRFGGGESTQMLLDRVAAALTDMRTLAAADVAWVTHAGVIRAASYIARGADMPIPGAAQWPREGPEPGGGICLDL